MDKKEYDKALELVESEQCRKMLLGLIELKGVDWRETTEKIKEYTANYPEATAASENLAEILGLIAESSPDIQINVEPAFARGLEYYTGMIFEIYIPELDIALGGGGRYDRLIQVFGGEKTPAVGCAAGIDRIAIALQTQNAPLNAKTCNTVAVTAISDKQKPAALKIAQQLRAEDIPVEFEVMGRKMGKALEDADKRSVDYAVIVGERELRSGRSYAKEVSQPTAKHCFN